MCVRCPVDRNRRGEGVRLPKRTTRFIVQQAGRESNIEAAIGMQQVQQLGLRIRA